MSLVGIAEQLTFCSKEIIEVQVSPRIGQPFETVFVYDNHWNARNAFYKTKITDKGKKRIISKKGKEIRIIQEVIGRERKEKECLKNH